MPQIRAAGCELVVLGNGTPEQARGFVHSTGLDTPVFTDPTREAYRIVGARRSLSGVLHPAVFLRTFQAWRRGFRQTDSAGDAMQLGGVFFIQPDGTVPYAYRSRYAGDLPAPEEILSKLSVAPST